jgi:hypothetical protein
MRTNGLGTGLTDALGADGRGADVRAPWTSAVARGVLLAAALGGLATAVGAAEGTAPPAASPTSAAASAAPAAIASPATPTAATPSPAAPSAPATPATPASAPPVVDTASLAAGVEEGVWLRRELTFAYMGFTSYYSCESLADKLKAMLRSAGAREDARVSPRGCGANPFEVTTMPTAQLVFYAFVPAALAPPLPPPPKPEAPAKQLGRDAPKLKRRDPQDPQPGTGLWRTVDWDGRRTRGPVDPGDCELVEQFVKQVLPLLTTRNVKDELRCVPRQVSPWDTKLSFEALGPLPPPEKAKKKR